MLIQEKLELLKQQDRAKSPDLTAEYLFNKRKRPITGNFSLLGAESPAMPKKDQEMIRLLAKF